MNKIEALAVVLIAMALMYVGQQLFAQAKHALLT